MRWDFKYFSNKNNSKYRHKIVLHIVHKKNRTTNKIIFFMYF